MNLILILIGLTIANFIYQAFGHHNWGAAFEHSWYQGTALLAVWVLALIKHHFGA